MLREKHTCWSHFGYERDVVVYHVGGSAHWVECTSIYNGKRLTLRRFQGAGARHRAIEHANGIVLQMSLHGETIAIPDPDVEFEHMVKQAAPMMNALPHHFGRGEKQ